MLFMAVLATPAFLGCMSTQPEGEPVSAYFPGTTTLGTLHQVRLGMTFSELQSVRRTVRPHAYVGASESFGRDTVLYFLDPAPLEGMRWSNADNVKRGARLRGIQAWSIFPSTNAADLEWAANAKDFGSAVTKVECYTFDQGGTSVLAAVKRDGPLSLAVLRYPDRVLRDVRGPIRFPASVVLSVGGNDPGSVTPSTPRHEQRCPT